jgi:two-component system response regulator
MEYKNILLIEDNQDDIELTIRAFRKNNLKNEIIVIKDGEKAVEYINGTGEYIERDQNKQPAVILLDLKLPKVDGIEILRQIKSNPRMKVIPVVILTSSLEEKDISNGYSFGANSYIRKPVDFNKFQEVVQYLGIYWLLLNELPRELRSQK